MIGNGELGRAIQAEVKHHRSASSHRPVLNDDVRVSASCEQLASAVAQPVTIRNVMPRKHKHWLLESRRSMDIVPQDRQGEEAKLGQALMQRHSAVPSAGGSDNPLLPGAESSDRSAARATDWQCSPRHAPQARAAPLTSPHQTAQGVGGSRTYRACQSR